MFCEAAVTFDHPIQVIASLILILNILGMCSHVRMDKPWKHNASGICYDNPFSEAESIGFNLWNPIVVRIFQSGPEWCLND